MLMPGDLSAVLHAQQCSILGYIYISQSACVFESGDFVSKHSRVAACDIQATAQGRVLCSYAILQILLMLSSNCCSMFDKLRNVRDIEYELDFMTNRAAKDAQVNQ